jgi:peptidoglycan/xylan/chitin deacetylase (PgdA/CDA1 family)
MTLGITESIPHSTSQQLADSPSIRGRWSFKRVVRRYVLAATGVRERLPASEGILLTFDDGPDPDVTPAVLDVLARFKARAVFFIVGNRIPRAPHVLARILADGHVIGNHTFEHPLERIPGLAEYCRDVRRCQDRLESLTGRRPLVFRPPLGAITPASLISPRLCGLRTLLWSIDVDDWKLRRDDEAVNAGNLLSQRAGRGDIVLLHDDNPRVVILLETALPRFCERGLDLSRAIHHIHHDA